MSLSGKLGFVPLGEILRLLTRSKQQGSVEVTGNGLVGRVFVGKGGIDLATTWGDDDLHRHLVNSGFADESVLRRITSGETTLAAIADSNQAMVDLVREVTVESLYQISSRGDEFQVREGSTSPYASPKSFELESLLQDAMAREKEWDKVSEVVPDLTGALSFRRDLGERGEVTVKVDDWKVLSEIGSGSSVVEIANHLGTTQFWAARVAARLVKNDLVILGSEQPARVAAPVQDDWSAEPESNADDYESPVTQEPNAEAEVGLESGYSPAAPRDDYETEEQVPGEVYGSDEPVATHEDNDDVDPDGSWWQEPKDEESSDNDDEKTPEVVTEGLSEMPSAGTDDDVEEDTEAFLEKVFSELETSEPEAEEGHGLLRRRRMGTLRDFSSDS